MKGFGKSCLVANILKDTKLVNTLFSNKVYWIHFACDRHIDEEIVIQLNKLYRNVRNVEIVPESLTPLEKDSLIPFFKYHFNKKDNRNALLILDDVIDKKIITTFDFECKTIVLTADIKVLEGKRRNSTIIGLNGGFTESETLGLFAQALNVEIHELPKEAKKIHEECKGMPLLIDMFASQFEEFKCDMRHNSNRWKYYLESLRKKDDTNIVMKEFLEKQSTVFDLCIEQLKPDLKTYYKSLAVFSEDVNITPMTLEILWNEKRGKVEDLMLELCHKSLVVRKWNNNLRIYIYGVHDLLLYHLRKVLTQDDLMKMHKDLIEKYCNHCKNDFSKLPDDNYIFAYIGYHLEQAKLYDKFQIYFDFDFIQAKIMHSGLNDLLLDLKKYRKYITCNKSECEANVVDIEKFLQEQASIIVEHRRKKCLDIIQVAMNHPYPGYVADTAKRLALTRQNHLYLSHNKNLEHFNMPVTEEILNICTSAFTNNPTVLLTGNTVGKIILWNCVTKREKVFNGFNENCSIKKILVSADGDCFLALSNTGEIKLFFLTNDETSDSESYTPIGSPQQKQSCWSGFFGRTNDLDDSLKTFKVEDEIILDMAFGYKDRYIAACTNKATVQIWDLNGVSVFHKHNVILNISEENELVTKITFAADAKLLGIMDESTGAFVLYRAQNKRGTTVQADYSSYEYLACYNLQLPVDKKTEKVKEKVIFFHNIPRRNDSLMIVTEKKALYVKWWWDRDQTHVHSFNKQLRATIEDDDALTYVCAAITYDGEYIVLADSAGFIYVRNVFTGHQPIACYKSRVISLDTYAFREEGHIICGNGNRSLYRWALPIQDKLLRKFLSDVIIKPRDQHDIVAQEIDSKIIILQNNKVIAETVSEKHVVGLQFSPDGNKIVYVTEDHNLLLYNIQTGKTDSIVQLDEPVKYLKMINVQDYSIIACGNVDSLKAQHHIKLLILQTNTEEGCASQIHKVGDNFVLTITESGHVFIWFIRYIEDDPKPTLDLLKPRSLFDSAINVTFSCLSHNETYLAILFNEKTATERTHLTLFKLDVLSKKSEFIIEKFEHSDFIFQQKLTCCDISHNDQYVAVGFETGEIAIIDITKGTEITHLSFHNNSIAQLSWAPTTVDASILVSVTNDELIWWNVDLASKPTTKQSRMGIGHSMSTPSLSSNMFQNLRLSTSQSVDTGVSNLQQPRVIDVNSTNSYWRNKVSKNHEETPALLALVELPANQDIKVHISSDFTKFVAVDMYGSISTFTLINYEATE
ncbi:apoptotic protease-activating factor 1-like isoform X3 [Pseudomyrmex gracilis]|nr:apoptotic protease-activating factor 1-like isoform X3 [Pseudomyrmex gracilis]